MMTSNLSEKETPEFGFGGIELIIDERIRQMTEHGYTPAHDKSHTNKELLWAATAYINYELFGEGASRFGCWPWEWDTFRPSTKIRNLTKAAALIVAEIDKELIAAGVVK